MAWDLGALGDDGLFVTGTDTGCGKTYVSCLIVEALRRAGRDAVGFKPVACGDRGDAYALQAAAGGEVALDLVNPVWFRSPAAPFAAAMIENRAVDLGLIGAVFGELAAAHDLVVVEGVGGWEVPLGRGESMSDYAVGLGFPVVVVVDNKLGAVNHTVLTVRAVQARGLRCAGIVLNHVGAERDSASISNRMLLGECLPQVPVLAEVLHGDDRLG